VSGIEVAFEAGEVGAEIGGTLVAEVAVFLEGFVDNAFEVRGQVGIQAERGGGRGIENGFEDFRGTAATKRQDAGGHLVEDGAEGKKITAGIEIFGAGLLGRHVRNGAERGTGTGKVLLIDGGGHGVGRCDLTGRRRGSGNFGKAEVENFGVTAFGYENVRGLNVAMNDALGVGGIEGVGGFESEGDDGFVIEGLAGDLMLQGQAIEKFHGDERLLAVLADFVDGADVGVVESGRGAGFAAEAFEGLRVAGEFFGKKFEGDEAAEFRVFGFVDDSHAAAAEFFEDAVVRDSLADHWSRIVRGGVGQVNGAAVNALNHEGHEVTGRKGGNH